MCAFSMHAFRERAFAITCPSKIHRRHHIIKTKVLWGEVTAPHVEIIPLCTLILFKKNWQMCHLVAVQYRTAATSQIRELESLCKRQRAIMICPSGKPLFALTAPTSTQWGFSRSAHFIRVIIFLLPFWDS